MSTAIKIVARHYDKKTGDLLEEIEIRDDDVIKAGSLKELGYLHMEQIDIMSKCQDFRVLHESNSSVVTKQLLNIFSLRFFPNHYPTYYSTLKLLFVKLDLHHL